MGSLFPLTANEGPWCPKSYPSVNLSKKTCMASLFFLFCLGMVLPGCLAVQVRDRSPSLPFLQRRTGDVIHHGGGGTSCVVKGSYCQCHYCKCEKGKIHCRHKSHHAYASGFGKTYCYGSMEGEYCHCDYCRCKHGYGLSKVHRGQCLF